MAVAVKQVIRQRDGLDIAGQIVALAVQQAVGLGTDTERGLDAVKADLVILGDMAVIEGKQSVYYSFLSRIS